MELEKKESEEIWKKFINREQVGTGSNGNRVYKVTNTSDNKTYAMKKIFITKTDEEKYLNEIKIFKNLNHPNIIKYFESFIRNDKLYIIMEYAENSDIKSQIKKRIFEDYKYFDEDLIWKWFTQIASAIKYIHSKKIIHRDIKIENIFLTSDNNIKLGDFGISKMLEDSMDLAKSGVGTPYYLSPEICQGLTYNFKSDIWMLGCLLYEICTLQKPFKSESIKKLIQNIIYRDPEPILNSNKYSEELLNLIKIMLKKLPEERPSIEEIWVRLQISEKGNLFSEKINSINSIKLIDKNKLKIEVEEESESNSPTNTNNIFNECEYKNYYPPQNHTPISLMNIDYKKKMDLDHKIFMQHFSGHKKYTPSYGRGEMNKIMLNMKISPMNLEQNNNFSKNNQNYENFSKFEKFEKNVKISNFDQNNNNDSSSNSKRRTSSTTNNSTPTNNIFIPNKTGNTGKNFRNRHYRHISINISSIQSPEHNATYQIDNIEKVEKLEFPSPINNSKERGLNPMTKLSQSKINSTMTPTNLIKINKISPKESLIQKEIPKTTKCGKQTPLKNEKNSDDNLMRKSLVKNFLIERYSREKFELMYDDILKNNKIDEKNIFTIVGEDFKVAINYLKYLTGKK